MYVYTSVSIFVSMYLCIYVSMYLCIYVDVRWYGGCVAVASRVTAWLKGDG